MSIDTDLRDLLDAVPTPPGDPRTAMARGRRVRRRRRVLGVAGVAATVAVLAGGLSVLADRAGPSPDHAVEPLGPLDLSHGLRAYADPGRTISLGGRTFDASRIPFLDTDATATAEGVVYQDRGALRLLGQDGTTTTLDDGDGRFAENFHPTVKADAASALVAYAAPGEEGAVHVKVLDLATGEVVADEPLGCTGTCHHLVVDGFDSGAVFLRTDEGTRVWRYQEGRDLEPFAGPGTRVADVRNRVVLYDGDPPLGSASTSDWRWVAGAVDSQLTLDGRYVLGWSSRLEPTDPADRPVVLDEGPVKGLGFWTVDTDGSVLVASPRTSGGRVRGYTMYDCLVPSGACDELGPLDPKGGDPAFIGNDM